MGGTVSRSSKSSPYAVAISKGSLPVIFAISKTSFGMGRSFMEIINPISFSFASINSPNSLRRPSVMSVAELIELDFARIIPSFIFASGSSACFITKFLVSSSRVVFIMEWIKKHFKSCSCKSKWSCDCNNISRMCSIFHHNVFLFLQFRDKYQKVLIQMIH